MFSRMQLLADSREVALHFGAVNLHQELIPAKKEISGFEHALHPVIILSDSGLICDYFHWGLVPPDWRKNPESIRNHTISAKLEYINKRYAWQKVSQNRGLIPATGYFEYHWNDPKGNSKTKYLIQHATQEVFSLAGLFSVWRDNNGNMLKTFAVCTTQANEIMEFVHNKDVEKNYHRMPVMLDRNNEKTWLDASISYLDFAFPDYKPNLIATPLNQESAQTQLF
jgi:putative SOS response-associated peptidase YedK